MYSPLNDIDPFLAYYFIGFLFKKPNYEIWEHWLYQFHFIVLKIEAFVNWRSCVKSTEQIVEPWFKCGFTDSTALCSTPWNLKAASKSLNPGLVFGWTRPDAVGGEWLNQYAAREWTNRNMLYFYSRCRSKRQTPRLCQWVKTWPCIWRLKKWLAL